MTVYIYRLLVVMYLLCVSSVFLGCLIVWGFTYELVRGCPIVPCFEHVRAGGGGGVEVV